jgi:hypothetical protein
MQDQSNQPRNADGTIRVCESCLDDSVCWCGAVSGAAEMQIECPYCNDGTIRESDGSDEFCRKCEHCNGTGWH